MARPRSLRSGDNTTARLWDFAGRDLPGLQEDLLALGMQKAGKDDLASALIWTARRMPSPLIKAIVEMYLAAEAQDYLATRKGAPPVSG
jgi:hypothetical protein